MKTDRENIRKIEARELAERLLGGVIVGERGLNLGSIATQILTCYADLKSAASYRDAFKATGARFLVLPIPGMRADPEISSPIIQSIPVSMIDNHAVGRHANDHVMQKYSSSASTLSAPAEIRLPHGVKQSAGSFMDMPGRTRDARKIVVIDESDMSARQGNFVGHLGDPPAMNKTNRQNDNRPGDPRPRNAAPFPPEDAALPGRYSDDGNDCWQRLDVLADRLVRRYLRAFRKSAK